MRLRTRSARTDSGRRKLHRLAKRFRGRGVGRTRDSDGARNRATGTGRKSGRTRKKRYGKILNRILDKFIQIV